MNDKELQSKKLEAIFRDASLAPVLKKNPKYCIGKFEALTPYIRYDDVMAYKFVIRGRPLGEHNSFDNIEREIIVKYDSIESLVNDGWRID